MSNDCVHHESHEKSIKRNEKDIQDLFTMVDKLQGKVAWIVGGITVAGTLANYFAPIVGK